MKSFSFSALLFTFIVLSLPFADQAKADYFVWEDEKSGVSLSYPDTWHLTSNQKSGDIFTINGPNDFQDRPTCRLNVREDGRFEIYPPEHYRSIQKISYSQNYWETEVKKNYRDANVLQFGDNAGLGRAFGSYIIVDYTDYKGQKPKDMRAIATAGYFAGDAYLFECKAERDGFDKWRPLFQSIQASIEFQPVFSPLPHGFYRNFVHN